MIQNLLTTLQVLRLSITRYAFFVLLVIATAGCSAGLSVGGDGTEDTSKSAEKDGKSKVRPSMSIGIGG